jgi:catechol 2,3-dioxygenase-like lactoylglutathione lyase family enzyme
MARKAGTIRSSGLNHINLNVSNLERSTEFYRKAFGLRVRFKVGRRMVFLGSTGGQDVITLCKAGKRDAIGNAGVSHFGFAMKGPMEKCVAQIERAGGKLVDKGEHGPGYPYAFIKDPDGYLIEIGN